MRHVYEGKTKTVFELADGNFLLRFKDDVTGKDGVFDPGANTVGLSISGMGNAALRLTTFFFEKLQQAGVDTHWIGSDLEKNEMTVKPAKPFGKGVEVICRCRAVGSFMRRYGLYAREGQELPALVEFTLKDDAREDPLINDDALCALGLMTREQVELCRKSTREIAALVKSELAKKGLELYDIKLEYGAVGEKVILIDEISGGNMRVYAMDEYIEPLRLTEMMCGHK